MPRLGEVIGALLSDLARARVRADLETIRLAEGYARHDLLRHMPVPRFRLPEVSVDLPVVLDRLTRASSSEGDELLERQFGAPSKAELTRTLRRALVEASLRVRMAKRKQLYTAIHRKAEAIFREEPGAMLNSRRFTREISDMVSRRLTAAAVEAGAPEKALQVSSRLKVLLDGLMLRRILEAPHLEVRVASSEIRESAGEKAVVRLNLRISEDSMEIVRDDSDDPAPVRLVPE